MRTPIAYLPTLFLLASVIASPLGAQEATREVSASITYRQRIALPQDVRVAYELRNDAGDVMLEDAFPTNGGQVPIDLLFGAPKDRDLVFRAAIFVDDQPAWLTDFVDIPAGAEPLALAPILLNQVKPMGFASTWTCGETEVTLGFVGESSARLLVGSRFIDLEQDRTASGARFSSRKEIGTWVWTKGDALTVSLAGADPGECREAEETLPVTLRAGGNEPGWRVTAKGDSVTLVLRNGEETRTAPLPEPQVDGISRRYAMPEADAQLVVTEGICHDTMTGMPYPGSAVLQVGDEELTGCAGDPAELLGGGEWRVEDIGGGGIIDSSHVAMTFENGRVAGSNGCNRYFASYELTGESLTIAEGGATMMACAEALMKQGHRFTEALMSVNGFTIAEDGALVLTAFEKPVIVARR